MQDASQLRDVADIEYSFILSLSQRTELIVYERL